VTDVRTPAAAASSRIIDAASTAVSHARGRSSAGRPASQRLSGSTASGSTGCRTPLRLFAALAASLTTGASPSSTHASTDSDAHSDSRSPVLAASRYAIARSSADRP
jgi:hypothetical protein